MQNKHKSILPNKVNTHTYIHTHTHTLSDPPALGTIEMMWMNRLKLVRDMVPLIHR